MNRFWGRNEDGGSPKFSRDDEQLLALNYENLCDADYLNRLFISDENNNIPDISSTNDMSQNMGNLSDSSLYYSDIAEDLVLFGSAPELAHLFFEKRFYKDIVNFSVKSQDNISSLVSRQSIVFEHIGKIMIERCFKKSSPTKSTVNVIAIKELSKGEKGKDEFNHNIVSNALFCALDVLSKQFNSNIFAQKDNNRLIDNGRFLFKRSSIEPIVAIVLQICEDTNNNSTILKNNYARSTRKILMAVFTSSFINSNITDVNISEVEELIRLQLSCLYSILLIGLRTKNSSDIILSTSYLMALLMRVEEWQESFYNDNTLMTTTINSPNSSIEINLSPVNNNVPRVVSGSSNNNISSINNKNTAHAKLANPSQKLANSHASSKMLSKPGSSGPHNNGGGIKSVSQAVPSLSNYTASNSGNMKSSNVAKLTTEENRVEQESSPPVLISNHNNNNNNNNQVSNNLKPWDKKFEKSKLSKKYVDIDPSLLNNSIVVNHVSVNLSNAPLKTAHKSNNNNNNESSDNTPKSKSTTFKNTTTTNQSFKPNKDPKDKVKNEVREFNEMIQNSLKIPKSVLRIIHDSCITISNDLNNGATVNATSVSTKNNGTSSTTVENKTSKFSTYVWSCGQNSYGELGVGDVNLRKTFSKVTSLDDKCIISIGAGNEHSVFVSRDGKLYSSGYNDNGQCGMGSTQQVRHPTIVQTLDGEDISQVNVYNGCEHTVALTRDGKMFSFGYNYRGQLGLGSTNSESVPRPVRGLLSRKVILAACSYHHTLMLCSDGSLFSCGRNDCGQLGHGDTIDKKTPQAVINCPRNINSISCGQFHTVAAANSGIAYVCGKNDYGQLGLESLNNVKVFTKTLYNPEIDNIIQVCCGYYHTLVLASNGVIAGFGRNDYGQLGLGHSQQKVYVSTIISTLRDKGVTMISAGCYHSIAVTSNGMLYVFGRNNHGQLATGDLEERHLPHPVDDFIGQTVISVAAGFYHTLILAVNSTSTDNDIMSKDNLYKSNVLLGSETGGENPYSYSPYDQYLESTMVSGSNLFLDATQFTGIQQSSLPKSKNHRTSVSLDSKSKVSNRQLLMFMMNQIDTFFGCDSLNNASSNDRRGEIIDINSLICSITMMIDISKQSFEDGPANYKLPISCDDGLNFMHKLIKIISSLLKKSKILLLDVISSLKNSKEDELLNQFDISCFSQTFSSNLNSNIKHSVDLSNIFQKSLISLDNTPEAINVILFKNIIALRNVLLNCYFSMRVDEDKKIKLNEFLVDLSIMVTKYHDIFMPTPQLCSLFFLTMKGNISSYILNDNFRNNSSSINDLNRTHHILNIRLLTIYCSIYKNNDEVVTLFQDSRIYGLAIFRYMLSLYNSFSKLIIEKKAQVNNMGNSNNTFNSDIRRIISVLECSIANFIKCAMPIIFTSAQLKEKYSDDTQLYNIAIEIIKEVLVDAGGIFDYLISQPLLTEEILCQLKYGTIMPSILPSILLYGIAFTKYGFIMLELIDPLRNFVAKIQMIGKPDVKSSSDKKMSKDDDHIIDGTSDDNLVNKKDNNSTWWYRLLKLASTYISKMATTLIYFPKKKAKDFYARIELSVENHVTNNIDVLDLSNHTLWNYLFFDDRKVEKEQLEINLKQNIQDNSVPDPIVDICKLFREREKLADPMYKMLTQSNNILFSNNTFHEIEDSLMEVFIHFYGSINENNVSVSYYFKLISRFIKYLHSKRSIIVSNSNGLSWVEILLIIHNVIKLFANTLLQCDLKIYRRPLLIGFSQTNKSKTFQVFRRVIMVIVCLSRWRNNVKIKVRSIGPTIINFIYVAANSVTNNMSTVDITFVSDKIAMILNSFLKSREYIQNYIRGSDILISLLDDSSNLSLKCDVLANFISSLRDKHIHENQNIESLKKLGEQSIIDIDGDIYIDTHCCSKDLYNKFKSTDKLVVSQLITMISNYCQVTYLFTQNDLNLISYGIKLLQLFNNRNSSYILLEGFPTISLPTLQRLLYLLNDKQKISNSLDEKTNKKIANMRERNIAYNRTIGAVVTYIQYLSIQSKGKSSILPNDSLQLCQVYNTLIRDYQLQRLESIRESNNADESTSRLSNDPNNKSGNIAKENNKKRCQDLISKPMEFNRLTEGFVVQGEKLINNNKGTDFSMAFWIMLAKQLPTKSNFVLGKVNHNDVWPIIISRGDGKLEIYYGNNNEFEKVVTEFSMSLYVWSHIAIVIEQKKIKIFINGVLDCQSTITKPNSRAISFPLIVGTCPSNVRTRVSLIKEGFDGLLAQFKYYSRALSPIHIRVIYDTGPPESSDVSEKLIYKLLCAMKSTINFVDNGYAKNVFQESANILHFLIVSDSSRRNRFAALQVFKEILLSDSIRDMQLCANSSLDNIDQSISILKFDDVNYDLKSFHEHLILYLVRLIGLSFAPHLLGSGNPSEENSNNNNVVEFISINPSAMSDYVKYTPNFIYFESNNGMTLAPTNGDCNNSALRNELCNHLVRLITGLCGKSSHWNETVSSVLHKILQRFSSPQEIDLVEIDGVLKTDSIGLALLLGGGSSGKFLGSTIINYFADSKSIILNVNTTTNYVTLLGQNMLKTQKQITRVRLTDIVINEDIDRLALSNFPETNLYQQFVPEMFTVMNKLSQFLPLLISDLFSILRPDHMYQYSVLLKGLRPLEVFLYNQLLKSVSFHLDTVNNSGLELLLKNTTLYDMVKQAALSTISSSSVSKSSLSDASDFEEKSDDKTISSLWTKSSKYLVSMPKKLVCQLFIADENETIFCDYIAQYFGLAIESILSTPYELLLRKGRMSELLFCLSTLETKALYKYIHDDIRKNYSNYSYITSDWSNNDSHLLEYDTNNALLFLQSLRTSIVKCSKSILCNSYKFILEMTDKTDLVDDLFLWESILIKGNEKSENLWKLMSKYYIRTHRIDITQSMACRLKFAALSLLQLSVMRSNDNILERTDIFGRIISNLYNWLELNNGTIGHEEVCYQILRTLLPALSFIECTSIELQLMQLCCYVLKILIISVFNGYSLSKEILDLAKSNNFTLLRARAQEQTIKYKGQSMATVTSLAYNLTQLMSYLEIIQRLGCIPLLENDLEAIQTYMTPRTSPRNTPNSVKLTQLNVQTYNTAMPKLLSIRAASLDADLSTCAASVLFLHQKLNGTSSHISCFNDGNILIEVAIGVGINGGDVYFETVYCGSSSRFVQSGLVPECSYVMKCRGYYGSNPMNWSDSVEFRTDKGLLFHFDSMKCGPEILLNDNLLVASYSGDDTWSTLLGSKSFSSGITSWDIRINQSSTAYVFIGIATSSSDLYTFLGGDANGWGFIGEQALYHNREKVKIYGESFSSGDIIGVSLDLHQGTLCFSKNGKSLGVAFDKIYGEFYPAVAFYNVGQELEILSDSFKTNCPHETIPISLSKINTDDISLLNEFTLSLYYKKNLSHRLLDMITEHCNNWCASIYSRHHTVSGREIYVMKEAVQLKKYGFQTGDRVRTIYGVAEVAGFAYNKVWFRMNSTGDIWFVSNQQIMDGKAKKLFTRCTYDSFNNEVTPSSFTTPVKNGTTNNYEATSIPDLIDMSKWSDEMDNVLINFLTKSSEVAGVSNPYSVSSDQVCDNFRGLQQQLSRLVMTNNDLSHKWGIAGPKRKAVLARIGLLRLLNQYLDTYLPFLITDTSNTPFLPDKGIKVDDFSPMVVSLASTKRNDANVENNKSERIIKFTETLSLNSISPYILESNQSLNKWPVICKSIENIVTNSDFSPKEVLIGPLHAMRNRIFTNIKMSHFWEVVKKSQTRPMKTDDDYDYPEDLAHVKINRLKSFRAKEAAELMHISGEDLILTSMFCQLWKELRQYSSEKLRISYTHPMDDGQSRTFKIKFEGEGVDDYGGPYREIFQQVSEELQMPDPAESKEKRPSVWNSSNPSNDNNKSSLKPAKCFLPLLLPTPNWTTSIDCRERYRFTLNPATQSLVYLDLFRFFGQFVGIAIRSRITLDLALTSYIYKCVVQEKLTEQDIASFDASAFEFTSRLQFLRNQLNHYESQPSDNTLTGLIDNLKDEINSLICDLNWTATQCDGAVIELIEDGINKSLQIDDIQLYLDLYISCRLTESKVAIESFRSGLISIIPEVSLSLLNWSELEHIICGVHVIDIPRLKENTEYDDDLSPDDEHIINFWEILSNDFSEEEKSAFLRFVWARPSLPPAGTEFSQKLRILSAVGDEAIVKPDQYLPKAHTCFFSINLPKYSTKEIMREKLRYAIFNCTEMDADFRTTESEIAGWGAAANNEWLSQVDSYN